MLTLKPLVEQFRSINAGDQFSIDAQNSPSPAFIAACAVPTLGQTPQQQFKLSKGELDSDKSFQEKINTASSVIAANYLGIARSLAGQKGVFTFPHEHATHIQKTVKMVTDYLKLNIRTVTKQDAATLGSVREFLSLSLFVMRELKPYLDKINKREFSEFMLGCAEQLRICDIEPLAVTMPAIVDLASVRKRRAARLNGISLKTLTV